MKRISIYLLVFVSIVDLFSQTEFEELEKKNLVKNNIISKTQWDYKYVDGKPVEEGFKSAYRKYDNKGNLVIIINYKFTGEVSSVEHYQYNSRGDRTHYIRYKGDRAQLQYEETIEYDAKGNKEKVYGSSLKAPPFNTVYNYNDEGKISEIIYYIGEAVDERRVFEYTGNTAHIDVLDGGDNVMYSLVNVYNSNGQVIEESKYEPNNSVSDKANYQYDSKGNVLKEEKYKYGQFRYRTKYTYNENGNTLKITQDEPNEISFVKNEYEYDEQGNLIKEKWRKKPNAEFSVKEYICNSDGLCTKIDAYYSTYDLKVLSKFSYKKAE